MSNFSSVRHAFPHPKTPALEQFHANMAGNATSSSSSAGAEPIRLSPVWWRCRFLAFFSLLGEEMIGDLATPRRAAREATMLLEIVGDMARAIRWRKELEKAEEDKKLRALAVAAKGLAAGRDHPAAATQVLLSNINVNTLNSATTTTGGNNNSNNKMPAHLTGDPTILFPNHRPMFDPDDTEQFTAVWHRCLRKVFFHSLLTPEEREVQKQKIQTERCFDRLPLPPREALPSEEQLEAVARRIFWVERIGAFYVAANASVPRDAESVDTAVGQLLLEGYSYEEIWERVQRKYGVYVVVHDRDAALENHQKKEEELKQRGSNNNGDDAAVDLDSMTPLERADYLLRHRSRDVAKPTRFVPGPSNKHQQQHQRQFGAARVLVADAATQTAPPPFSFSSSNQQQHKPQSSNTAQQQQPQVEEEEDEDDIAAVERIAQRIMAEKLAAMERGEEDPYDEGKKQQQQQQKAENDDDDGIVAPPPPPGLSDDEQDDDDGIKPPPKEEGQQQQQPQNNKTNTKAANNNSSSDNDELKLAALLLSSMHPNDEVEAFDSRKLTAMLPSSQRHSSGSTFLPPELKQRLYKATTLAKMPLGDGHGGIDEMRRNTVAAEQNRRAARLKISDAPPERPQSSYSRFAYDDHVDPVTGNIPASVIRALSSGKSKGEFERLRELSLAASGTSSFVAQVEQSHEEMLNNNSNYQQYQLNNSSGNNLDQSTGSAAAAGGNAQLDQSALEISGIHNASSGSNFANVSSMLHTNSSLLHQQSIRPQQQQQLPAALQRQESAAFQRQQSAALSASTVPHMLPPSGSAQLDNAAGVFRCAFHVSGVVRSQLVSHLNMPTAALLTVIGDFEEAVSACFERLPGNSNNTQRQRFDPAVPIRALAVKCTECSDRSECVEVIVALTGRQRPQPLNFLRGAAMEALATMAGQRGGSNAFAPMRLRAALGLPPNSPLVSFAVHDLESAMLPDAPNVPQRQEQQQQQQHPPQREVAPPSPSASPIVARHQPSVTLEAQQQQQQSTSTIRDPRQRLIAFYQKYDPTKLNDPGFLDKCLTQYSGKEEDLFKKIVSKYGPEPEVPRRPWSAQAVVSALGLEPQQLSQRVGGQQQQQWSGPAMPPDKLMSDRSWGL